jgi:hypothetical protein
MKRLTALFILIFCVLTNLYPQMNNNPVSFKVIPFGVYLQTGFLFVYIVLGILFLLMFVFYPQQRLNLYFSLYNISLAFLVLNIQFLKLAPDGFASGLINRLIGVFILLFMLYALGRMRPFFWWFIAFLLCIDLPLSIIYRHYYSDINEIVRFLFSLICFYLAIPAFRNRKPDDWLIGLIALAVVLVNIRDVLFFIRRIHIGPDIVNAITPFVTTISGVIYLALRYGRTNRSLENQLKQVRVLSEVNLKTEKEKQEILAGQNETLERQVEVH